MEENVAAPFPWLKDAIKNGIVLGFIHIVLFLVLYFVAPSKLTGFSYILAILIINLGLCIYWGIQFRKELGGYIDFKDVFKYTFVVLVTNGILNMLFAVIFLLLEPAYPQIMAQSQLDTSIYWAQKMGAPENSLEQMRDEFDFAEIEKRYNFGGLLFGFGIGLILYAIGALITALIVRKRQPEII